MSVEKPEDGEAIEFWVFKVDGGDRPYVEHCRSTFHANTPWTDHPWSAHGGHGGVGFVNEWTIDSWHPSIQQWNAGARGSVAWMQKRLAQEDVFTSEADARAYAIEWCVARMACLSGQMAELRVRKDRFAAGSLR